MGSRASLTLANHQLVNPTLPLTPISERVTHHRDSTNRSNPGKRGRTPSLHDLDAYNVRIQTLEEQVKAVSEIRRLENKLRSLRRGEREQSRSPWKSEIFLHDAMEEVDFTCEDKIYPVEVWT